MELMDDIYRSPSLTNLFYFLMAIIFATLFYYITCLHGLVNTILVSEIKFSEGNF